MYVYTTARFAQKAQHHSIQARVAKLSVAVETQGLATLQGLFEWNYPYLKRPEGNLRIIAKLIEVGNDKVLCLLDIFKRGGNDYQAFLKNPEAYAQEYLEPLVNQNDLQRWLLVQKKGRKSLPLRPPLPDMLHFWLQPPGWETSISDWTIYESEVWVTSFKQREIQDRWQTYHNIIFSLVNEQDSENGLHQETTNWANLKLCGKREGRFVLFSSIITQERKVLFLLAPFERKPSAEEIAEVGRKTHLFNSNEAANILAKNATLNELASYARRSYPDYLLWDEDIWLEIERESGTNWALSAEEEQILNSCPPPLFINGRAGSGKTTMLFYLFAEYCDRYQQSCREQGQEFSFAPHPLFLTYNKKLLEEAKKGVHKILECHHKFLVNKVEHREKLSLDDLNFLFQPFHNLLLNLLPPEEINRFDPDKHISFHQFKQLYSRRVHKSLQAEICWHVIRTFIKGYRPSYMTPEDYQEIPTRERIISQDTFQAIYNDIWPWYKQLTNQEGYWDDGDLIRRVLELKCYSPKYTAIFCDEAQDFTKLELRLIMQLSVFCQYDLEYKYVPTLPFAFAGDPLQTLNPTGFRWESVKAAFFDQAIAALDPARQLNIKMTFQELESNYRSSPAIVKVTNLIHLWRHVLFNIPSLKPQKAWQQIDSPAPQKFIFDRNISFEELKRHVEKDPIFIVPCEAGGEIDYIRQDEILSQLFPHLKQTEPPKNVLSAIEAKGLEFPLVILYKFGDQFAKEYNREIGEMKSDRENYPLKLEYFFNKLYVAASRAREELLLFDTIIGEERFWQYAIPQQFLNKTHNRNLWEQHVGTIAWGDNLAVLNRDNRADQAQQFEQNGLSQEDPDLLRRAKQFYYSLGVTEKADFCEASALKFEKRFREAGQLFLRRGKVNEAWECFWQGTCWSELKQWYDNNSGRKVEHPIVKFMCQNKHLNEIRELTKFIQENSDRWQSNYLSKPWKIAVNEYIRQIKKLQSQNLDKKEWQKFGDVLETLDAAKYNGCAEIAGDCYYRAENFKRAVSCWKSSSTQKREYNLACAFVAGFPEGLQYLEKAEDYHRIVSEWEKAGKPRNTQWQKNFEYVTRSLLHLSRYKDLIEYLIQTRRWLDAIAAIEKMPESEATSLRCDIVRELARSNLTPEDARSQRSRYKSFIEKVQSSDWQQHLSMPELGITLEKIGEFVPTLEFYEKFFDHNSQLQQFARQRWLATKKKQLDYEKTTTNTNRVAEIRQEINSKASEWNIHLNSIPLDPILPSATTQNYSPKQNPTTQLKPSDWIEGLPLETQLKPIGVGSVSFQIGNIEVKIAKARKAMRVMIADIFTSKELRVDLDRTRGKIAIGDVVIEASDGNQLSFKASGEDYSGVIFYNNENPRIELNIPGYPTTISLKLS